MGTAATTDFYSGDMVRELNACERRHWPRYESVHGELLVSPRAARVAELWTPETRFPRPEYELLTWHPADASTPFTLELETLFRPL